MCGIAGIHFFNSKRTYFKTWELESVVNELFLGIDHRGGDATGIATIRGNGDIWVEKAEVDAVDFVKDRTFLSKRVKTILLHTRFATKGHQSENLNNHPVINDNAVIIHNGHIRNDDSLFRNDKSLKRTAEVDSEAIAALFNKHGIEKAHLALQELEGGFAVAAIDQRKPTALVLAKGKGSPLTYFIDDNFIIWASESKVIIEAMNKVKPDFDLKMMDIDFLDEGKILYMDHGKHEKLEFKVKESPIKYTGNKSYTGSVYGYKNDPRVWSEEWKKEDKAVDSVPKQYRDTVPRVGTYQVVVDGRRITYRCCFKCSIAANEEYLKAYDGGWWCENCLEDELEWVELEKNLSPGTAKEITEEMDEEDRILKQWEKEYQEQEAIFDDMVICQKIASQLKLSTSFVNFFLFECEDLLDGLIENPVVLELYDTISRLYDVEVGVIVGDEAEKKESEEKKMEIVKFKGNEQQFIGL